MLGVSLAIAVIGLAGTMVFTTCMKGESGVPVRFVSSTFFAASAP
jgi:hypothetical protein